MKALSTEELVSREARTLAVEKLEAALAAVNLPLPKDSQLEIHITQLLKSDPTLLAEAARRVAANQDAYSEGLRAIGLEALANVEPVDLALDPDLDPNPNPQTETLAGDSL